MRPAGRKWRSRFATLFLLAGIAGTGIWTWSVGHEAVYEDWSNWSFDRQVAGESTSWKDYLRERWREAAKRAIGLKTEPVPQVSPATEPPPAKPVPSGPPAVNSLIGRLSVPRLGVHAIVREGTTTGILGIALGHIVGTALPGQSGNVAVAGHRDTLFRGLRNVQVGDQIEFETPDDGKYLYEVENTSIVSPTQVSVLKAGLQPELTLVTCYPFNYVGSAPYRFIVKARQVGRDTKPAEPALIAEKAPAAPKRVHRRPKLTPMPYSSALLYRSSQR